MGISLSGFSESGIHLNRIIQIAQVLIILLFLGFFIINSTVIYQIDVWRHDAIYNTTGYFYKLQTEGRWINYLLWPYLKLVNPYLSIFLKYCSIAYFIFRATYKVVHSIPYAAVVALVGLQIPVLYVVIGWPMTGLPAVIALGLSAYLSDKIPLPWFMLLFASIFFGTLSSLFFLMPLLFISNITFKKFVNVTLLWMITFVLGFIVAQLFTYLNSFEFIQLADWRQPHYIQNVNDLIVNTITVYRDFLAHNRQIIDMANVNLAVAVLLVTLFLLKLKADFISLLMCFIAGIAVYITVIPAGLNVAPRTAFTYWVCLIFIFMVRDKRTDVEKIIALGLALMVGTNMALASNQVLTWYSGVTNTMKTEMRKAMPLDASETNLVLLSMTNHEAEVLEKKIEKQQNLKYLIGEQFSETKRIIPVLKALGYENVRICHDCSPLYDQASATNKIGSSAMFKSIVTGPGEIIVFVNKELIN